MSRGRWLMVAVAAVILAAAMMTERAAAICAAEGGHLDLLAWRCRVAPPIQIQRDLKRAGDNSSELDYRLD